MQVGVGCWEVAKEGWGVFEGVLAATNVEVSAIEKESSTAGEGDEVERVGSTVVVESEMVWGAAGIERGANLKTGWMEIRALQRSGADHGVVLWSLEVEGVGFQGDGEVWRPFVLGAIVEDKSFKNGGNGGGLERGDGWFYTELTAG